MQALVSSRYIQIASRSSKLPWDARLSGLPFQPFEGRIHEDGAFESCCGTP